nr:MAG TPA: Thymidylate synthase complementing protein [Crassvirales sp.]
MKLIKQSFEILEQTDFSLKGIKQFIERCGRVCYKSEDKITDTSYKKFVDILERKDHARPLEFGTVHLKMKASNFQGFIHALFSEKMFNSIWIKCNCEDKTMYITTNYRYYLNIIKQFPSIKNYFTEEDNKFYPKRYTVHFITSRGIMDEFRTHVTLSHLAESTRYCDYGRNKFGNEIVCVIPHYCSDLIEGNSYDLYVCKFGLTQTENLSEKSAKWVESMCQAEQDYMDLLNDGCTAQEARDVLPLGVKSELISCGFGSAWCNFFYRRCAKDAHPMAREIAIPLQDKFKEMGLSFAY